MSVLSNMEAQQKEFAAADAFARAMRIHNGCAVVDDDYPEVRFQYEGALAGLIDAMKGNGRFDGANRYRLAAPSKEAGAGARTLTCVYCGHEYAQDTPAWGDQVLTDHIAACAQHPMRTVISQRDGLRAALVGLVGASDPGQLRAMELAMRTLAAPDEDRAATINAIHALLQSSEAHQVAQA